MAIKFNCPKCGKKVGVPETAAGKTGKCPGCGTTLTVPKTPAPPPVRPDKQGATDYSFRLTDEDRARIEEEERFRAEARARAERQVRSKETPPHLLSSPVARSRVVTFSCPYCFSEMTVQVSGDVAYSQEKTVCPSCRQSVMVPSKSKAADAPQRAAPVMVEAASSGFSFLNVVCALAFVGGIIWAASAYTMDTTVEVPQREILGQTVGGGRVYNVGLMQERQNGIMVGGGLAILGLVGLVARQMALKRKA